MAKHLKTLLVALVGVVALGSCVMEEAPDVSSLEQEIAPPPSSVTATPTSTTRIALSWSAVPGAVKYYIYERVGAAGAEYYATTAAGSQTSTIRANLQTGTEYCYRLRTVDASAIPGDFSSLVCATTFAAAAPPAPPANVMASAISSSRINVSWSSVANAERYFVYQSDTGPNGSYAFINTVLAPGTSLSVANLQAATEYCFKVASFNANGTSALSAAACDTTFVAGLEGYWKLNEGSGTATNDASGFTRNGTLNGATWSADRAPIDNNRFSVALSGATADAVNIADAAPWRFPGPFTLSLWTRISSTGTTRIAGKRASNCGAVNWELGHDTAGLYLAGAQTLSVGQSITVDRWTHLGVTWDGTTVVVYIDGVQAASGAWSPGPRSADPMQFGNSGSCGGAAVQVDFVQIYSRALATAEIETLGLRPPPPANFVATPAGCRTVSLSWDAVAGASKYFVFKGTTSGDQVFLNTVLAPATSYTDGANPSTCSTQVSYYVLAARNSLISDPSNEQIVTTLPAIAAPSNVAATAVSSSRIHVTFSAVADATKYYVYRSQPGGGGPFVFDGTVLATSPLSHPSANLAANTLYTYYVVSQGPDSVSVPSNTASATTAP